MLRSFGISLLMVLVPALLFAGPHVPVPPAPPLPPPVTVHVGAPPAPHVVKVKGDNGKHKGHYKGKKHKKHK